MLRPYNSRVPLHCVCAHHPVGAQLGLVPPSSARQRSRVNVSPVLALAGLAAIGLLATRLPHPAWRRVPSLDPLLAAGGPLVVAGPGAGAGPRLFRPGGVGAVSPRNPRPPARVGARAAAPA